MTNRERALYHELRIAVAAQLGHGDPETWTQKHFAGLSEEIQEKTGQYLSSHTLRRVFGRLPNPSEKEYLPQMATLDILCQYASWEPWLKSLKENPLEKPLPPAAPAMRRFRISPGAQRLFLAFLVCIGLLTGAFFIENALYQPRLVGIETAGTAPFRVIYRVEAPYIGYHSVEVIMATQEPAGLPGSARKPIYEIRDPATQVYPTPGIFKAILMVDGKKTDSLSSLIYSKSWFGFFQQDRIHFPATPAALDSGGLTMSFLPGKMPDTSRMFHTYQLYYDSTGIDPEDFMAEVRFLCNKSTDGKPWYNTRFKVFGSRHNLEVEVIDDHNKNNYLEIRHYFGEISRSGISTNQRACLVDMERPVHIRIQNRGKKATVWINRKKVLTESYTEPLGAICGLGLKSKGRANLLDAGLFNAKGERKIGLH